MAQSAALGVQPRADGGLHAARAARGSAHLRHDLPLACRRVHLLRSVRNTLKDSAIASKIDASDKERLEKMVTETIEWMDHNQVG